MKYITKLIIAIMVLSSISIASYSQNAKKFYKDGKKALKEESYTDAISLLTQAISLDSTLTEAYIDRAVAFEKTESKLDAANDYAKASQLDVKELEYPFNAGKLFYELEKYKKAVKYMNLATAIDKKNLDAYRIKLYSLIELEQYKDALAEAEKALLVKKTDLNYYFHGVASYHIGNYETAESDFTKAIKENATFSDAYLNLAKSQYKLNNVNTALESVNESIKLNAKCKEAFVLRSELYHSLANYPSAINDLSTILTTISIDDEEIYYLRGKYYREFNQFQNAINDFCKVIGLNEENVEAYYERAQCYESISKTKEAVSDYEKFMELATTTTDDERKKLQKVKEKIYDLNRESIKPVIVINSPVPTKETIEIRKDATKINLKGNISDDSKIEYLTINGEKYDFPENAINNEFEISIDIADIDKIELAASDIYHNLQTETYTFVLTEIDPPVVHLTEPYASDNNEIYLETSGASLFIEGKVTDESLIKSITIEGTNASYKADELNPKFTATIDITNKTSIKVKTIDVYGNINDATFTINREGLQISENNPMGKTWVIFIENSNYQSFASLDGPAQDVTLMKSTFANYNIHRIIHKQDMTKAQMERFFSIELRDLVKENRVNSLLVWYSGHGKFIHETGYWIPVNASRDDEFTYFNINNLKASMQSYSSYIKHTLVITDACESGPSFYMAMRSEPKERDCGDWTATKFKSSQVFTSAGNELAADKSQFTQTFANTLKYNPDDCIPIENIVLKVTKAVSENGSQKPRFGKIAGLEDEDGTFFFMKKTDE